MSRAKRKVRRKYPLAACLQVMSHSIFVCTSKSGWFGKWLGIGFTRSEAWADAARRMN